MKVSWTNLTDRELEVLALVVQGRNSKEIGPLLGISYRTVHVHRTHLMAKLEARNAADLVRIAILDKFPIQYKPTKFNKKEGVRGK